MKGKLAILSACLLLAGSTVLRAEDKGKTDVIWVVDASVSAGRSDLAANARGIVSGITGLAAGRIGRVAVLRYGGWAETLQDGVTVLPPTHF